MHAGRGGGGGPTAVQAINGDKGPDFDLPTGAFKN